MGVVRELRSSSEGHPRHSLTRLLASSLHSGRGHNGGGRRRHVAHDAATTATTTTTTTTTLPPGGVDLNGRSHQLGHASYVGGASDEGDSPSHSSSSSFSHSSSSLLDPKSSSHSFPGASSNSAPLPTRERTMYDSIGKPRFNSHNTRPFTGRSYGYGSDTSFNNNDDNDNDYHSRSSYDHENTHSRNLAEAALDLRSPSSSSSSSSLSSSSSSFSPSSSSLSSSSSSSSSTSLSSAPSSLNESRFASRQSPAHRVNGTSFRPASSHTGHARYQASSHTFPFSNSLTSKSLSSSSSYSSPLSSSSLSLSPSSSLSSSSSSSSSSSNTNLYNLGLDSASITLGPASTTATPTMSAISQTTSGGGAWNLTEVCLDANSSNLTDCWGIFDPSVNDSGVTGSTAASLLDSQERYWAILLIIFPLFTVFGNVLVVLSVFKEKSLKTVTNYFICSLAVADIMVAVFVMPFAVYMEVTDNVWTLSDPLCDAWVASDVLACTASILNLTAISVDRFIAVTQPIKYAKHKNSKRVFIMLAVTWIISVAIAAPITLGVNYSEDRNAGDCRFFNADFIIYSSMGSFYIPSIIMIFLYWKIYRVIRQRAAKAKKAKQMRNVDKRALQGVIENTQATAHAPTGGGGGNPGQPHHAEATVTTGLAKMDNGRVTTYNTTNTSSNWPAVATGASSTALLLSPGRNNNEVGTEMVGVVVDPGGGGVGVDIVGGGRGGGGGGIGRGRGGGGGEKLLSRTASEDEDDDDDDDDEEEEDEEDETPSGSASGSANNNTDPKRGPSPQRLILSVDVGQLISNPMAEAIERQEAEEEAEEAAMIRMGNETSAHKHPSAIAGNNKSRHGGGDVSLGMTSHARSSGSGSGSGSGASTSGVGGGQTTCVNEAETHFTSPSKPKVKAKNNGENKDGKQDGGDNGKKSGGGSSNNCKRGHKKGVTKFNFHMRTSRKRKEKSSSKREKKATKTLAIVLGVFLICWVPFFTLNNISAICIRYDLSVPACTLDNIYFSLFVWLGWLNSFLNPVIYTIFNPEFRKAFRKLLTEPCQ